MDAHPGRSKRVVGIVTSSVGLGLIADLVRAGRKRVMLVGHEPDLSMLVHRLVGKMPDSGMQKAMVVSVRCDPSEEDSRGFSTRLRFVLEPKTLSWQRD